MKIFITGITGFVGGAVANHFISLGHEVNGIGRKTVLPGYISNACIYHPADICFPLGEIEADIVIHTAALASDTASYQQAYNVNVKGTVNVLDAVKNIKHFIYISSSSVYDFHSGNSMEESEAGKQFKDLSAYGKTKWLAEETIHTHTGNYKKTILRPRAIYGKHDQVLLPRLLKLVKGNKIIMPAHLSKYISLTQINNLIQSIELCIQKQLDSTAIFNVADNEIYNLKDVLLTLLPAITAKKLNTLIIPVSLFELIITLNEKWRPGTALNRFAADSLTRNAVLNIDKISQTLHYKPSNSFYDSYQEIADWVQMEKGWKHIFKKRTG